MYFLCNLKYQDEDDYPDNLQFTFHLNHICRFSCPGCCTHPCLRTASPPPPQQHHPPFALPWAKEEIKTNRTLISGSCFCFLSYCGRNPLQEGCLKSKLPAHHLPPRRSLSQQQNQQKQLFIPFDVGLEVTPPLPLCPPSSPSFPYPSSSSPSPSSFLYLLLPRKQGHACFSIKKSTLKEQQFRLSFFFSLKSVPS